MNDEFLYGIKTAPMYNRYGGVQQCPVYKPNECFAMCNEYPHILVGNRGTVYDDIRCIRLPIIFFNGRPTVSIRNYDWNGNFTKTLSVTIRDLILRAHYPNGQTQTQNLAGYVNLDTRSNYYNPYDPNSNLEWMSKREILQRNNAYKNRNSGEKKAIFSDDTVRKVIEMWLRGESSKTIGNTLGFTDKQIQDLARNIMRGRAFKDIAAEYPAITPRTGPVQESTVRRICELNAQGYDGNQIVETLRREGIIVGKNTVSDVRHQVEKYRHVTEQYDFSNAKSLDRIRYSESDIERACQLIVRGYSYAQIYQELGLASKGIPLEHFRIICSHLKYNKNAEFRHISNKYFKEDDNNELKW